MSTILAEEPETPSVTPRVLTNNLIPTLTQGLDASDVVEVYALVRSAPLHGIANSTIHFQKMVLGVRYRPPGASAPQYLKEPVELTLEYGPQRLGPRLTHEATPFIQVEASASFISWDNVGKIYYTTKIASENYLSSYYMASMTGAVLNKILVLAVEYAEKRRRYQPFTVYSEENGKELKKVRSSSSSDFIHKMWQHLAELGVEIEPILPPPIYEARLWVGSVTKLIPEESVTHAVATFYQNLYQCLEALATNDYGAYMPSAAPTISPAPTPSPTGTLSATSTPSGKPSSEELSGLDSDEGDSPNATRTKTAGNSDKNPTKNSTKSAGVDSDADHTTTDVIDDDEVSDGSVDDNDDGDDDIGDDGDGDGDGGARSRLRHGKRRLDQDEDIDDDDEDLGIDDDDFNNDSEGSEIVDADTTEEPTNPPVSVESVTPTALVPPTNALPTAGQDAETAQQAAQDAQIAANEAKDAAQTEGETKAANAAQAAADAAQTAADATSNAASQATMDGLLSGDGSMMSSIVTSCFTNPQYGIASVDENGTVNTEAYLYRDGSRYYKLVLTSPYFEVVKVNRPLPKAVTVSDYGAGGDFVDWVLIFCLLGIIVFGALVTLQQMGNKYIESLYKCQRWFFNPRKYDYEGDTIVEQRVFEFGADGIPLSMGGRRTHCSPIPGYGRVRSTRSIPEDDSNTIMPKLSRNDSTPRPVLQKPRESDGFGEVELSMMPKRMVRTRSRSDSSRGSLSDDESIEDSGVPERLIRDPDLVEFPDLKSKSKVAVPVGASGKPYKKKAPPQEYDSMSNGGSLLD